MDKASKSTHQTKQTARIGKRIRRLRAQNWTWERISRELGIIKANGEPDPGLAYKISEEDYEPKSPEIRERLHLKKMCLTCMRALRADHSRGARIVSPWKFWWSRLSPRDKDREIHKAYDRRKKER